MKVKIIGIYMIKCKTNNKVYIGSSLSIYSRLNQHIDVLNGNSIDVNRHLKEDWMLYGESDFEFSILEECSKDVLKDREDYYMKLYKSLDRNFGYNIKEANSFKQSEETKAILRSKKIPQETKIKLSALNTGDRHPKCKTTLQQAKEILNKLNNGFKIKDLSVEYNYSFSTLLAIKNGYHWTSKLSL